MARIRTVKPEFWRDEPLSKISAEAALLAIGLLNYSDDEGYFNAHPKLVESDVFPLRDLSVSIHGLLNELSNIGYIQLILGVDNKMYGKVTNFEKHQFINRKTASKIKDLIQFNDSSMNTHGVLTTGSGSGTGNGKEMEHGKEEGVDAEKKSDRPKRGRAVSHETTFPDDLTPNESVIALAEELNLDIDRMFRSFKDNALAKGLKYVDWQRAIRTWLNRADEWKKESIQKTNGANGNGYQQRKDNDFRNTEELFKRTRDARQGSRTVICENESPLRLEDELGIFQ